MAPREVRHRHTAVIPLVKHCANAVGSPDASADAIHVMVPVRLRHEFRLHVGGRSSTASLFCSRTGDGRQIRLVFMSRIGSMPFNDHGDVVIIALSMTGC